MEESALRMNVCVGCRKYGHFGGRTHTRCMIPAPGPDRDRQIQLQLQINFSSLDKQCLSSSNMYTDHLFYVDRSMARPRE
ncbi:hypothetical protein I7I53_02557 [Histoplasma capsulatum var. duboisii H88]|uniref:Uncharacterized protein n=1 Tax=Ajellomyces capsulatus (strain H88) TaxID=544711 RepID=A0A8A1LQJ4_AJEC8|nr:hypothetical protein I7I53_02557 [Histoplasma capsulatum var. duboisii H88]